MATYDLEQQEQLDQFKHFWKTYGNLISWVLAAAVAAYAGWTGYQYWQTDRAAKAAGMYEELDRAAVQGDADKVQRVFSDLKGQYGGTTLSEQGALLAAQTLVSKGKSDEGRAALQWLVDSGKNPNLAAVGRLRLAGVLLDQKKYDEALSVVSASVPEEFKALAADRRGDILQAQGKKDEALKAYQEAYKAMDAKVEYRRFIEGKLTALGEPPADGALKLTAPNVSLPAQN
ncbi:MAG: hypothetical protein RLZZ182_1238 [Pseudomonadota bacterium]|jgi:predicted negative regulator of RcsB-dependent stress response